MWEEYIPDNKKADQRGDDKHGRNTEKNQARISRPARFKCARVQQFRNRGPDRHPLQTIFVGWSQISFPRHLREQRPPVFANRRAVAPDDDLHARLLAAATRKSNPFVTEKSDRSELEVGVRSGSASRRVR